MSGNGTAPNISGILDSGNYTAHGYLSGALGSTLAKMVLIRKMMADCWADGYMPDGVLLNPADWATIENELMTTAAGRPASPTPRQAPASVRCPGDPVCWHDG